MQEAIARPPGESVPSTGWTGDGLEKFQKVDVFSSVSTCQGAFHIVKAAASTALIRARCSVKA